MFAPELALAAPRSVTDCAAITNAFAYNECLATFGPKMGEQHYQPAPPAGQVQGNAPAVRGTPNAALPQRVSGSIVTRRAGNGRIVAEFAVGRPAEAPVVSLRRHRRYHR